MSLRPIRPIYRETLPDGTTQFGLTPDDFERVRLGYACSSCLEPFPFALFGRCPVCGHVLHPDQDFLPPPQHWLPDPNDPRYDEE